MTGTGAELTLLIDIGLIVILATVFNFIARYLKQPTFLAYIIAGITIGPLGLSVIQQILTILVPGTMIPLALGQNGEVAVLSELGIAFLLFSVGIETDFSKMKSLGKVVTLGTILQVGLTALFSYLLTSYFGLLGFEEAIYLGVILAFSSTMVVVKILSDSFQLDTLHGRLMIGFLIMQDILIILLLPLLSDLSSVFDLSILSEFVYAGLILIVFTFALSKYIYPKVFEFSVKSTELLYLSAISSCFLFMFVAWKFLGLPIAIGAFTGGLALSALPFNLKIYDEIRGLRDFFVTIFFVTLGMQISFSMQPEMITVLAVSLVVVFLIKPLLFYLVTLFSGHGGKVSLLTALGLAQVSEFSFILASQGLAVGIISEQLFSTIILIVAISMVVTPYIFKFEKQIDGIAKKLASHIPESTKHEMFFKKIKALEEAKQAKDHIIIIGGGTMGYSLVESLRITNQSIMVLDRNPQTIQDLMDEGLNAVYGFAGNSETWGKLNIEQAKLIVLAIPDSESSVKLLIHAKKVNPKIKVFARAHYYQDAVDLYEAGADFVCMPHLLGSNLFMKIITEYLETGKMTGLKNFNDEVLETLKDSAEEQRKRGYFEIKRKDLIS